MNQERPSGGPGVLHGSNGQARLFPGSESTHRNYVAQWNRFVEWADHNNVPRRLPVASDVVVRYIEERYEGNLPPAQNRKPSSPTTPGTLRVAIAAIAYMHERQDLPNPCVNPPVRAAMERLSKSHTAGSKQSSPLDRRAFDRIRETATLPRTGRAGRTEKTRTAMKRGLTDIALIGLMRDALLRVGEAATLKWENIEERPDGSGRVSLSRSRTGPEGVQCYVSAETMCDLAVIRCGVGDSELVFNMSHHRIAARIRRAAEHAGLGERFNGSSPRIGTVHDLAAAGADLYEIQQAGRWRSVQMPAQYLHRLNVNQHPVARWLYGSTQ